MTPLYAKHAAKNTKVKKDENTIFAVENAGKKPTKLLVDVHRHTEKHKDEHTRVSIANKNLQANDQTQNDFSVLKSATGRG